MQAAPKVHYATCPRGGYHTGEALNMLCLDQKCHLAQLCCCACVEETHKDHNTKPLRVAMLEAQQASQKVAPVKFNIDAALEMLAAHELKTLDNFTKHAKTIQETLQQIEISLRDFYRCLADQVKLKNIDPKIQIKKAFETVQSEGAKQDDYVRAVKRISELLVVKREEGDLTESDILGSLSNNSDDMRKRLESSVQEASKQLQKYQKELGNVFNADSLWKKGAIFKFSPNLKHPDIKILSDHLVKSTNNSGYKFSIMEPHLEGGNGVKKFAFKIKESLSNWVAVGMCHPKVVIHKNYGFNFSSIGHGAYMVSANGGSWSHTKAQHNNSVKSFKFVKGDIIQATVNTEEKIIYFKKNTESYQIPFETIPGDELSPCVLFYYLNDEVEFLPNFKE